MSANDAVDGAQMDRCTPFRLSQMPAVIVARSPTDMQEASRYGVRGRMQCSFKSDVEVTGM
jgi:methyl coenzyme M reductase subunit C